MRVMEAQRSLLQSDQTITQIALCGGFWLAGQDFLRAFAASAANRQAAFAKPHAERSKVNEARK